MATGIEYEIDYEYVWGRFRELEEIWKGKKPSDLSEIKGKTIEVVGLLRRLFEEGQIESIEGLSDSKNMLSYDSIDLRWMYNKLKESYFPEKFN